MVAKVTAELESILGFPNTNIIIFLDVIYLLSGMAWVSWLTRETNWSLETDTATK